MNLAPERMESPKRPEPPKINWIQVAAGALASVSSAWALSTLGVAETILGAALGSIVFTVASAVYSFGLHRTGDRLRDYRPVSTEDRRASSGAADETRELVLPPDDLDVATARRRRLSRRQLLAGVLAVFVLGLGIITVVEVIIGQSISSVTGGRPDEPTMPSIIGGRPKTLAPAPSPEPTQAEHTAPSGPTPPAATPTETPSQMPGSPDLQPPAPEPTPAETTPNIEPTPESTRPNVESPGSV